MRNIMKRALLFLLIFSLLATAFPAYAVQAESSEEEQYDWETDLQLMEEYEPNVIIVKMKDPALFPGREKQYNDAVKKVLGTGFEEIAERTYLVQVEELSRNPKGVLNRFKSNQYVEYVEPNYMGSLDLVPSDPLYATRGYAFAKYINAEAGWDIATQSGVKVGIVDTGYSGSSDLPDASGYSIYNGSTDLTDLNGHGTQVAGTLGAIGENGLKSVGVVWNANILPVKISESSTVTVSNVSQGIRYAADHGAKIINLSLSFPSDSATLRSAVDYAYQKGCVLVAATGNDGAANVSYPAAYSNVMGVGGCSIATERSGLSNYGSGLDVLASWTWFTTTSRDTSLIAGGTSIAAPQVSGLAALVWQLAPKLTNAQVMQLIRDNTIRAGGVWDSQTGYGTIDMAKTLKAAKAIGGGEASATAAPTAKPDTTPPVITLKGGELIELTEGDTYEEPGYSAQDDTDGDLTSLVTVSGKVSAAYAGEYTLTYMVIDQAGNVGTAVRRVVVSPAELPPENKPAAPTITLVGSNPIILHLGGSPYIEQGAQAYDEQDGDLSAFVTTKGEVNTSQAGTYHVEYSVTNSADLSASVTREVRVLAPQETIVRTPYSFSGQGKAKTSNTHYAQFESPGEVELRVSGLNKMTLSVSVVDGGGREVFNEVFTGNGTRTFFAAQGSSQIQTKIISAKGNGRYELSLLGPETGTVTFEDEEVPMAASPDSGTHRFVTITSSGVCFGLGTAWGFLSKAS